MRKIKVIIYYLKMKYSELLGVGRRAVLMLTDNDNFEDLDPTLVAMTALLDDLEDKHAVAEGGDHDAHLAEEAVREKVALGLTKWAKLVDLQADGDEIKMAGSGLPMTKIPSPSQRKGFWVALGENPGDVLMGCAAYPKAGAYTFQYAYSTNPPAETAWQLAGVALQTKLALHNMEKGDMWVRYCAVTKDGMKAWHAPIHIYVL